MGNKLISVTYIFLSLISQFTQPIAERKTFILITNLYNETNRSRIAEYQYCIMNNLAHPLIKHIHVLYDTSNDIDDTPSPLLSFLEHHDTQKLTITKIPQRQTYSDNFTIANTYYPNKTIIIANADIFFDSSLELVQKISLDRMFLCLTRWDVTADGKLKILSDEHSMPAVYSQDVWIFKSPIALPNQDIPIGTLGCDNRIAYEMLKLGYDIANPCLDLRCCHLHLSSVRNYTPYLQKKIGMVYIPWCTVSDLVHN